MKRNDFVCHSVLHASSSANISRFRVSEMSSLIRALRRSSLKHKKLCEEWGESREPVLDGVTFFVKYVGSCLVDQAKGERSTAEAIKTIVAMAKASGKKLDRVAFLVNPSRVRIVDQPSQQQRLDVPIYRISYCSADAYYDHIFAFIAVNKNETLECYAFLCPKKKIAHAVTLTIAQAFNIAFEVWQNAKDGLHHQQNDAAMIGSSCSSPNEESTNKSPKQRQLLDNDRTKHVLLIDFEDDGGDSSPKEISTWHLEDDFNLEINFEKFIETRYYPPRLDTNLGANCMPDLHHYITSRRHLQDSQCFLKEDSCDLLMH